MDNYVAQPGWGPAYAGYVIWLIAGSLDFWCHRRTHLAQTSGLAESVFHLVQLALIAVAAFVAMCFEVGRAVAVVLLIAAIAHAIVGFVDTRCAFRSRVLLPVEQHLHSMLDMAPWIALAWVVIATWPKAIEPGWQWVLREPPLDPLLWLGVMVPGVLLCGIPAAAEFRSAWRHAHQSTKA